MLYLFHHLVSHSAHLRPDACALMLKDKKKTYGELHTEIEQLAEVLINLGLEPNQRVAIYLPKQFESVISFFATTLSGGVFVPINPLLKPKQVEYIINDCSVDILITSKSRFKQLVSKLGKLPTGVKTVITDLKNDEIIPDKCLRWQSLLECTNPTRFPERINQDMAAILYTSGSTGQPKGVVLSHQNLVEGAKSVVSYLHNTEHDRLLAVLPFSFDYGLSQLTTAFLKSACVVLLEYLLPRDVINAVIKYKITGLAAVPPLWIQLADFEWPEVAKKSLRYFTNSGGAMPESVLSKLRCSLPNTSPFLMYGLTEAFRSTYLDPSELDNKSGSIGKAIPNAEVLVLNDEGNICKIYEEGELVHRGVHVAMGYWNSPEKTAERFKPFFKLNGSALHNSKLDGSKLNRSELNGSESNGSELNAQIAVWSGDRVKKDKDGFLYFVGRNDEMIKSSGYRISPMEIEDCLYQNAEVDEVVAFGVTDEKLGQKIKLIIKPSSDLDSNPENADQFKRSIISYCKKNLPNFMQPKEIELLKTLPRNANGKIDRSLLVSNSINDLN